MWYKKPSILFIVLYLVIVIIYKMTFPHSHFISSDNFGYYMHLPAKYIYKDVPLKTGWHDEINNKYLKGEPLFQLAKTENGNLLMRFYKGMSYIWTPGFFVAHLYALQSDEYPADGFSLPYARALIISGFLFYAIGIFFSRKILLKFFNEITTTITLFIILAGTNLFFVGSVGNDVPHGYLFTLFSMTLWFTIRWHEEQKYKHIIPLGLTLGLIIAIRPIDLLVIIIPVLWGVYNKDSFIKKLNLVLQNKLQILTALTFMVIPFVPQLLYYHEVTGKFLVNIYSDPNSTFNFLKPDFFKVLIGFRKGWFIYSPLCLLGFIGIMIAYRKFREYFFAAVVYYLIFIYIIASFTSLVSYGWRVFIESYSLLLIPTAIVVNEVMTYKRLKLSLGIVVVMLTILNLHQSFQIHWGIIDGSRMTMKYYFSIIGKNSTSEEDRRLLLVDRSEPGGRDIIPNYRKFNLVKLYSNSFEDNNSSDSLSPVAHSGTGTFEMNANVPYSPGIKMPYSEITKEYYCYIRISVQVYSEENVKPNILLVVTTVDGKDQHLKYRGVTFKEDYDYKPGQWNLLIYDYLTPEINDVNSIVQSYVWYNGNSRVWIDDLNISAYTIDGLNN